MFPGFAYIYKDSEGYVHLYFYPGINDYGRNIYGDLDIKNCKFEYEKTVGEHGEIDYKFTNKTIIEITCKLVRYDNKEIRKTLTLR